METPFNVPECKKLSTTIDPVKTSEVKTSTSRFMHTSRTYPRVSPSRKVSNINIVLPKSPAPVLTEALAKMDENESKMKKASPKKIPISTTNNNNIGSPKIADTVSAPLNNSVNSERNKPYPALTYIKPWKASPCRKVSGVTMDAFKKHSTERLIVTPLASSVIHELDEELPTSSSPDFRSSDSDRSSTPTTDKLIPKIVIHPASPMSTPRTPPIPKARVIDMRKVRVIPAKLVRTSTYMNNTATDDNCLVKKVRLISTPRRQLDKNGKELPPSKPRLINLYIKNPYTCMDCKAAGKGQDFLANRRISIVRVERGTTDPSGKKPAKYAIIADPPRVMKRESAMGDKSLVQELIEEFNEKMTTDTEPSLDTPVSNKFVRKLVSDLQNEEPKFGDCNGEKAATSENQMRKVQSLGGETSSEGEIKSAARSSATDVYSVSGSSIETKRHPPSLKSNTNYDFHQAAKKTDLPQSAKEHDESVYWIPIGKPKLQRTSTRLSNILSNSLSAPSPNVSPIHSIWGTTYTRQNSRTKNMSRVGTTAIPDSGYSDFSVQPERSSGSSDENWSDEMGRTRHPTPRFGSPNDNFTITSDGSIIYGRSIVI